MNFFSIILSLCFVFTSCHPKISSTLPEGEEHPSSPKEQLCRVHVVDHNNMSETITNAEKIKQFAQKDFLDPQPYKKVLRLFEKGKDGSIKSILTSYYENGQIRQYLECLNGRACGSYFEWYSSGKKKAVSHIVAGQADLGEAALLTWSFDKVSEAWDEDGNLQARVSYDKGKLQGLSETFYPSGARERISWFEKGELEGKDQLLDQDGSLLEEVTYLHGKREGPAVSMHGGGSPAWKEEYSANRLITGSYYALDGTVISSVKDGAGIRSLFDEGALSSQQEIQDGVPQGKVSLFEKDGSIDREYFVKNGKKEGKETRFYQGEEKKIRLQIEWKEGSVHGVVKTWYPSGTIESQREMRGNIKQGLSMAWYPDGSVMLVEEYENDSLRKGRYHKKGENASVSQVNEGEGVATLFDQDGSLKEKILYHEGRPQVTQN